MDERLDKELESRMETRPDRHTLAWWREQWAEVHRGYRGVTHAVNRCLADYESADERIQELGRRVQALGEQLQESQAEIGRLHAELEEKLDRVREVYQQLKNGE